MDSDTDATPDTDDPDTDTDQDTSELARAVIKELDTGTVVEDKIVVSRRGLTALIGAGLGTGALSMLGVDKATAQTAAGQVGTSADRVDVFAADVDLQSIDGNNVVSSGESTDYRIEKNGTDGSGVINFKTN